MTLEFVADGDQLPCEQHAKHLRAKQPLDVAGFEPGEDKGNDFFKEL